jgi:ribosomal protein S12
MYLAIFQISFPNPAVRKLVLMNMISTKQVTADDNGGHDKVGGNSQLPVLAAMSKT